MTMGEIEIEIDIVHRVVRAGQSVIHLSGIEQSLLYLLAGSGGRGLLKRRIRRPSCALRSSMTRGIAPSRLGN